jgi:hypothetical protein
VVATKDKVLRDEAKVIRRVSLSPNVTGIALYRALNQLGSSALCLSGGGIRSAAFALGVIQALAIHPRPVPGGKGPGTNHVGRPEDSLLAKFHYLSTVSGGGYIGSWLSAWRRLRPYSEIWASLVGRPDSPDREPASVRWLRSYSNYLTPRIGFKSMDTWTALALSICNLLLNWILIVPVVCALVLLLKLIGVASTWIILWDKPHTGRHSGTAPTDGSSISGLPSKSVAAWRRPCA